MKKTNMITVGVIGAQAKRVSRRATTVRAAIEACGYKLHNIDLAEVEIKRNNNVVQLDDPVRGGDIITLSPPIRHPGVTRDDLNRWSEQFDRLTGGKHRIPRKHRN